MFTGRLEVRQEVGLFLQGFETYHHSTPKKAWKAVLRYAAKNITEAAYLRTEHVITVKEE